jgi:hypothetical protein
MLELVLKKLWRFYEGMLEKEGFAKLGLSMLSKNHLGKAFIHMQALNTKMTAFGH